MKPLDLSQFDGATPGPWHIDRDLTDNGAPIVAAASSWRGQPRIVAKALFHSGSEDPEVHTNARLIAAAPALLHQTKWLTAERARLTAEVERLREVIANLLKWRDDPKVHASDQLAWIHGFRLTDEDKGRLYPPWIAAIAVLSSPGTKGERE